MSLILEALKKLDREKKVPDRGFLVVGAVPWPTPRPRRWLPALLVVAVGVASGSALWLAWRALGREEARGPIVTPSTLAAPAAMPPAPTPLSVERQVRVPETPPTMERLAPPKPAVEPGSGLQLQAISERDGRPVAIISGRLVHEGDHYDGVTIMRIGADEVEIEVRGRRRTLRF